LPFKEPRLALRDIAESIEEIEEFTAGLDLDEFRGDAKSIAAVERKIQVISEAAMRLGDQANELCPGIPWHEIRGIGNWLRHQYDRVDVFTVWNTIQTDLPPLKAAVREALTRFG
jgi:uncharacterized protein with HEPN domain